MSGLTNLQVGKVWRRGVVFWSGRKVDEPVRMVVWLRVRAEAGREFPEMAVAKLGTRRKRLRWKGIEQVMWMAFGVQAKAPRQMDFEEIAQ